MGALAEGDRVWLAYRAATNSVDRDIYLLGSDDAGQIVLVWTEGTGWNRGGELAWQAYDADLLAIPEVSGRADGVPVWSFATVVARPSGKFEMIY